MKPCRPLIVIGTRPEAIKVAPVVHHCRKRADSITPIICFTGQHGELLRQTAAYFQIEPDVDLQLMRPNQSLAGLTARALERLDACILQEQPDCVLAQGDTTTVLASSMAAFYRDVPFVHVEAGLRTGNLKKPWPEEFNRRVTALATSLHCAPTQRAAQNLHDEGIHPDAVHVTGNTVVDALLWTAGRERGRDDHWKTKHPQLADDPFVLITGHRRESFGDGIRSICDAIVTLATRFARLRFVYPVHPNPNVRKPVTEMLGGLPNVDLIEPAPYPEFVWLMDRASLILTDSGGVQEEAPSLGKPVLVMRDTTERPEGVELGLVHLVGTNVDRIVAAASKVLVAKSAETPSAISNQNPYGDGRAASRIVDLMLARFRRHVSRGAA